MKKTHDPVRQEATSTSDYAAPLPAGTYLVGDPCYAFTNDTGMTPGHDYWSEWLDATWDLVENANRVRIQDGEVAGFRIAASGTAYGDGVYPDQHGNEYGVDAGLIGAVPWGAVKHLYPEDAHLEPKEFADKHGMVVFEFDRPFHVTWHEEDETISVGSVIVQTGDEPEEEEDPLGLFW